MHGVSIPTKDANARDPPDLYYYWVNILDLEKEKNHDKAKASARNADKDSKWIGSLMEVRCENLSRDRLSFSKSILRRFIRDCVDRDPAVASPWTVKPDIAKRYGIDYIMPEATRRGVENIKKGEIDKRKKVWEDKELPPGKKQKKTAVAQEALDVRERDAREKADKQRLAKEEADRKKKKPVRYPTEDLDVRLGEKDKKAGMKVQRPKLNPWSLPFCETVGCFEPYILSWNFLVDHGHALHLSTFTLDDYDNALRHMTADPPCPLLAEIHATLIYNLRTVPFTRHSALLSMLRARDVMKDRGKNDEEVFGVSLDELTNAMADVGSNWERVPLRQTECREGWEDALVGCLKDHATLDNFPRLREVLTQLLFGPDPSTELPLNGAPLPPETSLFIRSPPSQRYHSLPCADRIDIIHFMCNVAVSSKAVHAHIESCEEQLTALRKEKIEVNRLKKQYLEDMNMLLGETKDEAAASANGVDEDTIMHGSSDLSDVSEGVSEATSTGNGKKTTRSKDLRLRAHTQAHSKEREAARAKQASAKQAQADHRRLDEEVNKLERRLESIEREFRKLLGAIRVKPLGRDRFYNRIWWFDGLGSASLVGGGGVAQYGTGRLFIQGPSEFDMDLLQRRRQEDDKFDERRAEEEGEGGTLQPHEWGVYTELSELDEFLAWLNPKGHRELALKTALGKWWVHITAGIKRRLADLQVGARMPDARRSGRTKVGGGYDITREPYMMWTNRRAASLT